MARKVAVTVNGKYVLALYMVRNAGWEVSLGNAVQAETWEPGELSRVVSDVRKAVGSTARIEVVAR